MPAPQARALCCARLVGRIFCGEVKDAAAARLRDLDSVQKVRTITTSARLPVADRALADACSASEFVLRDVRPTASFDDVIAYVDVH